jgi:hypothetical protein
MEVLFEGKFRARVTNGFLQSPKIEISGKAQKSLKNRSNCPWPFGHPRTRKIPLFKGGWLLLPLANGSACSPS